MKSIFFQDLQIGLLDTLLYLFVFTALHPPGSWIETHTLNILPCAPTPEDVLKTVASSAAWAGAPSTISHPSPLQRIPPGIWREMSCGLWGQTASAEANILENLSKTGPTTFESYFHSLQTKREVAKETVLAGLKGGSTKKNFKKNGFSLFHRTY